MDTVRQWTVQGYAYTEYAENVGLPVGRAVEGRLQRYHLPGAPGVRRAL